MTHAADRSIPEVLASVELDMLLTELAGPPVGPSSSPRWRCPAADHPDRHPSVTTHRGTDGVERWRCWSGGHGGTAVDALVVARGHSVGQAIEALREHSGSRSPASLDVGRSGGPCPVDLHPAVVRYVEACERIATSRTGREVLDWLVGERRLDAAVLRVNRVGVDPGPALFRRPYGLPRGGCAAVLPVLGPDHAVAYVQARYLAPTEGQGKYDNPAARMGPNPRVGFVRPVRTGESRTLLVCEGLLDAYVAAAAGFEAVGVLGAGLPDRRVIDSVAAASLSRTVMVAFDNDDAGRRGSDALVRNLSDRGVSASALKLPTGVNDLADWAGVDARWYAAVSGQRLAPAGTDRSVDLRVPEIGVPGVK